MMRFDTGQFLSSLARCTRFNPQNFSGDQLRKLPLCPGWNTFLRGLLGELYALTGGLTMLLVRNPLIGAVAATAAILLVHAWLTAGRENRLPLQFGKLLFPHATPDELRLREQLIPAAVPLLLFLLVYSGGAYWLGAIFAFAAAGAGTLSTPPRSHEEGTSVLADSGKTGWAVAVLFSFVTMALFFIASPVRHLHFVHALVFSAFMVLITPWLRHVPGRPAGFTANCLLCEVVGAVFALLALAL